MIKQFCDFCGSVVNEDYRKINITHPYSTGEFMDETRNYIVKDQDICFSCLEKIFPQFNKKKKLRRFDECSITFSIVLDDGSEYPYVLPRYVADEIVEKFYKDAIEKNIDKDLCIKNVVISMSR